MIRDSRPDGAGEVAKCGLTGPEELDRESADSFYGSSAGHPREGANLRSKPRLEASDRSGAPGTVLFSAPCSRTSRRSRTAGREEGPWRGGGSRLKVFCRTAWTRVGSARVLSMGAAISSRSRARFTRTEILILA